MEMDEDQDWRELQSMGHCKGGGFAPPIDAGSASFGAPPSSLFVPAFTGNPKSLETGPTVNCSGMSSIIPKH